MAEDNILMQQRQADGSLLVLYPFSKDGNIAYDNSQTNYKATNVNEAFLATLRAPQIQVVYNG